MKRLPLAALALASVSQAVCGQPAGDANARFKSCLQLDGAARGQCLETIARELSGAGKRICLLEARDRVGGRVSTLHLPDLPLPIELGAEFIHGELGTTFDIVAPEATEEQLEDLRQKTEQYCVVFQTLAETPDLQTEWA